MTKRELINWIRRSLGEPMVKVELHDSQIEDCILQGRYEYVKWAVGNATEEVVFTVALSAGIDTYEMPSGVTEIVKVKEFDTSAQGINTLFSVQNYLYNQGVLSFLDNVGSYSMIEYHMALEFIDLLDRYMPNYYTTRYDRISNTLRLRPTPELDNINVGYLIIHSYMIRGTTEETFGPITDSVYNSLWESNWLREYSLAKAKKRLGLIRRKFANFSSIGNEGISLDGDSLVSEADQELERLEEKLKLEESYEGLGIVIG